MSCHRNIRSVVFTLICLTCFATPSLAQKSQDIARGYTLTLGKLSAAETDQASPFNGSLIDEEHIQTGLRLGYRMGRAQPFMVLDYGHVSSSSEDTYYDEFDDETYTDRGSLSMHLLTVGAGLKYALSEPKTRAVQTYLVGSLFTFIPLVTEDGKRVDEINDDYFAFGLNAGFGAQYSFHPRFSAGAELGLKYARLSRSSEGYERVISSAHLYHMFFMEFVL